MIYLDYQATTPLDPAVRTAMAPWWDEKFGNPHSPHRMGREAAAAVDVARAHAACWCLGNGRLSFTSGATEALNWAIKGTAGPIVTLATEHAAILDSVVAVGRAGRSVTILPVGRDGLVDLDVARAAITPGVGLVTAMLVNNEIGVIQPIAELVDMAHAAGALFLCDAVQGYGRVTIPPACDMIAMSAHKIHGPKGIGGLWMREGLSIEPLIHGGGQDAAGRSGTLSPALCVGFGSAAQAMLDNEYHDDRLIEKLWPRLADPLLADGWTINGSVEQRWRGNLNVRKPGLDAARLISELRELAVSAGSACASGSGRPSHVLKAIGLSEAEARSSIRLGFGRFTTEAEIDMAVSMILDATIRQRKWA